MKENVQELLNGAVGVWIDGDCVKLKATLQNGVPVPLSLKELESLISILNVFAKQIDTKKFD